MRGCESRSWALALSTVTPSGKEAEDSVCTGEILVHALFSAHVIRLASSQASTLPEVSSVTLDLKNDS